MALTSGMQCSLTEDELVEVLENLPSDLSELSDSDSDNYLPENSDSDSDENNRVDPLEPAPKKLRSDAPLQWSSGNFTPNVHDFNKGNSGIRVDLNEHSAVFDFFKIFFPVHIMQHIADETNKYYLYLCEKMPPSQFSRLQKWANTTVEELYIFFAITMLMS